MGLMFECVLGLLAGSSVLQHTVKCLPPPRDYRYLHNKYFYYEPAAATRNTLHARISHDDDQQLTALVLPFGHTRVLFHLKKHFSNLFTKRP